MFIRPNIQNTGYILADSLVSYWKLDEASGTRFDAHGTNHLDEIVGTLGNTPGVRNNAAAFTGTQRAGRAAATGIKGGTDFTLGVWVNFNNANLQTLAYCGTNGSLPANTDFYLWREYGNVKWAVSNGTGYVSNPVQAVPTLGIWYCVLAGWRSVDNKSWISVNNATPSRSAAHGSNNDGGGFYLGERLVTGQNANASLDEVGFWGKELSVAERATYWNGGLGIAY